MQRKKPLRVIVDATQPSVVEIITKECVQLDRIVSSPHGRVAERHGPLLQPGTTRISLDIGQFCFQALSDTQLRVVQGGVATTNVVDPKDPWPLLQPVGRGDDPDGDVPSFTVL